MPSPPGLLSVARQMARRFSRNRRGSTAVEFALVAPMFFLLLFAIMETALVFFAGQILEISAQDTARLIFTNQAQGTMTANDFKTNLCNRIVVLMSCGGLYVDVKTFPSFSTIRASDLADPIDSSGNFVDNFNYPTPAPGDTVIVRAYYQWPLFVTQLGYNMANINRNTSTSKKLLTATIAFRVEPGPGS
jgi:Flp pilus assembly protein TadG